MSSERYRVWDCEPSSSEIREFREANGCGLREAKQRLHRQNLVNFLHEHREDLGTYDISEIFLLLLEGEL